MNALLKVIISPLYFGVKLWVMAMEMVVPKSYERVDTIATPEVQRIEKYLGLHIPNPPRKIINPHDKEAREIISKEKAGGIIAKSINTIVGGFDTGRYFRASNTILMRTEFLLGIGNFSIGAFADDYNQFNEYSLHETMHAWERSQGELLTLEKQNHLLATAVFEGIACIGSEYVLDQIIEKEMVPILGPFDSQYGPSSHRHVEAARDVSGKFKEPFEVEDELRNEYKTLLKEYSEKYSRYQNSTGMNSAWYRLRLKAFTITHGDVLSTAAYVLGRDFVNNVHLLQEDSGVTVGESLQFIAQNPPQNIEELLDVDRYMERVMPN